MNAVVFGAGRIGRGFLGQLLFEGGYETTFVDSDAGLVGALNRRRGYPLRLVSNDWAREIPVAGVCALHNDDLAAVCDAMAQADLAATAIGVGNLPHIAPTLAAGLQARSAWTDRPLDILLCENQWHVAALVRDLLQPHLPCGKEFDRRIGLVQTVVGRMVPVPPPNRDPLLLVAEPYGELPVAGTGLRGPAPALPGLIVATDFPAYEARKLFLHNAGHAALAYVGHERHHEYIWQCVADPNVSHTCRAALAEASQALAAEYGFVPEALRVFSDDLMRRFANRALGDTVARVAADPRRKLRPEDRLLGAFALCRKHGITPTALEDVIAAAVRYAVAEGDT